MSADRAPGTPETLDEAREKIAALQEQVRVWRHLAETGSIMLRDFDVVGSDEASMAMMKVARRSGKHADQGAKAMREKCTLAMIAGASPEDMRALPMPTPAEIMQVVKAEITWPQEG